MYICGGTSDKVHAYNLSTAYDISTAVYNSAFLSTSSEITQSPVGMAFDSTGSKLTVMGNEGKAFDYTMPLVLALGTGSFASADVGKTIEINSGVLILTATTGTYVETTAPSSTDTAASGDWSMYAVVYDAVADVLETSNGTTGFDLSIASFTDSFSVASQETVPEGIAFNTDGTKMFIVGSTGDDVNEYTLTTGFDVSTATFSQLFSVVSQDNRPYGIAFNTDGTKMFIVGNTNAIVSEYTLSTGFDVSTASFVDSFSVSAQDSTPQGLAFNTDGTKMFVVGNTNDTLYEYALSTGFDVSTSAFTDSFSIAAQDSVAGGLAFNTTGTKMFVVGSTGDAVYEYSMGSVSIPTGYQPCIGSNIDSTYWTDINSLTATNAVGDGNVFYAVSNDDKTTWSVLDNTSGVRPIARVSGGTWQYNSNTTYGSTTWVAAASNTEVQALRDSMAQEAGFILADAAYDSVSFSVAAQETLPAGIAFNTDGTKMYVVGDVGNDVNEYALSTGFNVSTASYTQAFSVSGQDTNPWGVAFNADGTKMFILGYTNLNVYEYALTTGFNVSTASYTQAFSVSAQDTSPRGLAFNADGTKMFVVGITGQDVNEYALTTGFDVSTASYTQNFSVSAQDTSPFGLAFNTDGTKMYVVGQTGADVNEYTLSTGFNISTASYTQNFSVSAQDAVAGGIAFNPDGTKMYIVGNANDTVYQYSTSGMVAIASNQMNSTTLNAITDANQISLATDLDFAVIMYIATGTTVPTYSGTAMNYDAAILNQGAILGTDYNFDAPAGDKVRITAVGAGNYKIRVV
jgi:sugar lactone lactonase YvrE